MQRPLYTAVAVRRTTRPTTWILYHRRRRRRHFYGVVQFFTVRAVSASARLASGFRFMTGFPCHQRGHHTRRPLGERRSTSSENFIVFPCQLIFRRAPHHPSAHVRNEGRSAAAVAPAVIKHVLYGADNQSSKQQRRTKIYFWKYN